MADILEVFAPHVDHVVVAFAAGDQRWFQWGRSLMRIAPHVLVRDSSSGWYQNGVASCSPRQGLVNYIKHLADPLPPHWQHKRRVTTLGMSAGAYAALMYGQLAGVDKVIAISPVTAVTASVFAREWHHRFVRSLGDPDVEDLAPLFAKGAIPQVRAFVTDGPDCELDAHMARRIGVTDITLIPGYDHGTLARGMINSGLLEAVLRT